MNVNANRDNLYKWYLISGLVIGLFALYVPWQLANESSRSALPLEISTRRAEIEANDLFQKTDAASKALKADGQPDADGKPAVVMSDRDKKATAKFVEDSQLALNIKYAEIKASNAELSRLKTTSLIATIVGIVLVIIGAGLFICGAKKWHLKVQSIQDYLLQNDLDKIATDKNPKR